MEKKLLSWADFLYIGYALSVMMSIRDDSREEFLLLLLVGVFFVCTGVKDNIMRLREFATRYPLYTIMTVVWTVYFAFFNKIEPRCDKYAISVFAIIFAGYSFSKTGDEVQKTAFSKLWVLMAILITISIINFFINPPENSRMNLFYINPNIEGYAIIVFLTIGLLFISGKSLKIFTTLYSLFAIVCTSSKACSLIYVLVLGTYLLKIYIKNRKNIKTDNKRTVLMAALVLGLAILAASIVVIAKKELIIHLFSRHAESVNDIISVLKGDIQPVDNPTSTNSRIFDYTMALEFFPKGSMVEILLGRGLMHQFLYVMRPTFYRVLAFGMSDGLAGPAENTLLSLLYDSGAIAFALYGGIFITAVILLFRGRNSFIKKVSAVLSCLLLLGLTVDMEYLIGIMFFEWLLMGVILGGIEEDDRKQILVPGIISCAGIVLTIVALPELLSWIRTIRYGSKLINTPWVSVVTKVTIAVMMVSLLVVIYSISKLISKGVYYRCIDKKVAAISIGSTMVMIVCVAVSSAFITKIGNSISEVVSEEKQLVENITNNMSGKLYVDTYPEVYDRVIGNISKGFFSGRELVAYDNTTVITDIKTDSYLYETKGFVYTPISDSDAVYTNDEAVINYLEGAGYKLTSYNTFVTKKKDEYSSDNLFIGKYTATFDLNIENINVSEDSIVCALKVLQSDGVVIGERNVNSTEFDTTGKYKADVPFTKTYGIPNQVKFVIEDNTGYQVKCDEISYKRTPDYDVRIKVDELGRQTYVEYYDLEGSPTMISSGIAGVHKDYDYLNRVSRVEYFDTNGERMLNSSGISAEEYEFDEKNHIVYWRYYDTQDTRNNNLSGYSGLARIYDDQNRVVGESYYDINDEPVALANGQAGDTRALDENGNVIVQKYYGLDGEPVMTTWGYAEIHRVFNENKGVVEESYYDINGEPVAVASGVAELHRDFDDQNRVVGIQMFGIDGARILNTSNVSAEQYEYDEKNRIVFWRFYDTQDIRTYNIWGFSGLSKSYDEQNRVVGERYYDTNDVPVTLSAGQAGDSRVLDEKGNVIEQKYYGLDGKPVMLTGGYAEVHRQFDEDNRIIRVEYYDLNGELTNNTDGYAVKEIEYDESGEISNERYYDNEGQSIIR